MGKTMKVDGVGDATSADDDDDGAEWLAVAATALATAAESG